jgi:hypothetical protein
MLARIYLYRHALHVYLHTHTHTYIYIYIYICVCISLTTFDTTSSRSQLRPQAIDMAVSRCFEKSKQKKTILVYFIVTGKMIVFFLNWHHQVK